MQVGKCNAVPVNTFPVAYTVRGRINRWNVLTCSSVLTGGKLIIFFLQEGRGIRNYFEFTSRKLSEAIRYVRCVNYIDRRVIMLMFVHLSGMQYA